MLFGVLNQNIFMLFAGENRLLYEAVLMRIYNDCFSADLMFPTRSEIIGVVYDALAQKPKLWHDESPLVVLQEVSTRGRRLRPRAAAGRDRGATVEAMERARHIYARLLETGWLEESRYGLRVTVDMPPAAMRLAEFLSSLRQGSGEQLGGLIVEVKNALDAVKASASQNALGLHKAAKDAVGFGRYLRSVLSSLREIDRQILASQDLSERLQHYFEEFVGQILLKDFASISTTAHPYRFRFAILDALQVLEDSPADIESLAAAYGDARLASQRDEARDLVFDDLQRIRRVLVQIDEAFLRIQQHRSRLEIRLRNTVKYAGRRAEAYLRRSEDAILNLDRIVAANRSTRVELSVPGTLQAVISPFSFGLLARPRGERASIVSAAMPIVEPEPIDLLRRQLEREYLARITVKPEQVLRFLDTRVLPEQTIEARDLLMVDLDDFLAFEALRRSVQSVLHGSRDDRLSRDLEDRYRFSAGSEDGVDNDWVSCSNFSIHRVTPPAP
ncbi:Wadjet anti-phage system protein JetA family protein [Pseudochelatococcus lubricantis]|uniref:Wadjet anti-phage system protein JetA family protein n=1 Tax=Pseudochelatococcus lubricantis TaxID=1538102 RepID=UPI0035E57A90